MLAVYEHGIFRIVTDQKVFGAPASCQVLDPGELIERAVTHLTGLFRRHAAFLRPIVLLSGAHPEVLRRGRAHVQLSPTPSPRSCCGPVTTSPTRPRRSRAAVLHHGVLRVRRAHRPRPRPRARPVDHDTYTAHLTLTTRRTLLARESTK